MGIGLRVYVAVFLFYSDKVLLLKRSDQKSFAPGLWTGVGGRVEQEEFEELEAAAFRELQEETGLKRQEIRELKLRVVVTRPESGDLVLVCFYSGLALRPVEGLCREGELKWIDQSKFDTLDMIENAREALESILSSGLELDVVDFLS
jgi:8-oxo-dGTP diphosphatase